MAASLIKCRCISITMLFLWAALASLASSRVIPNEIMLQMHKEWMGQYDRVYKDATEKAERFNIFRKNVEYIESVNQAADRTYKLAVNQFADLTLEEFKCRFKKQALQEMPTVKSTSFRYANVTNVPSEVDWRKKGAVTAVRNQGAQCGGCWAISAIQTVEGITKIRTGKLIPLSAQQVKDCDTESFGCGGGWATNGFKYIIQNKGVTTEANYPYEPKNGACDTSKVADRAVTISGFEEVPTNNEAALLQAVANQPVAAMIDWNTDDFRFYKSGIFTGKCSTEIPKGHWHTVTVVGYGTTSDGIKYWIVKNSAGTRWGEGGYMRMLRDISAPQGLCGIAIKASYPIA